MCSACDVAWFARPSAQAPEGFVPFCGATPIVAPQSLSRVFAAQVDGAEDFDDEDIHAEEGAGLRGAVADAARGGDVQFLNGDQHAGLGKRGGAEEAARHNYVSCEMMALVAAGPNTLRATSRFTLMPSYIELDDVVCDIL